MRKSITFLSVLFCLLTEMAEAQTSITSKEGLSNEKVYVIKSGRTKNSNGKTPPYYVLYNEAASEYLSSTYGAGPATAFDQNSSIFQFSIYKYGEKYYIYSIAAHKFVGTVTGDAAAIPLVYVPNTDIQIIPSTNSNYPFCFTCNAGEGLINATPASGKNGLCNWASETGRVAYGDEGNVFQVLEVGDLSEELQLAIPKAIAASMITPALAKPAYIGEGVGHYAYSGTANVQEAMSEANELLNSSTVPDYAAVQACVDKLNEIGNNIGSINQPETGKVYRFKCVNGGKWLSSATNSDGKVQMTPDEGLNTYFYLNESNQLLSYNTGQYTGSIASPNMKLYDVGTSSSSVNTFTFKDVYALSSDAAHLGTYGLYVNNSGNARNLYGTNTTVDSGSSSGSITGDTGYHWTIEEVTELPVVINSTYKLGTLYSPVPLVADESKLKFFTGKIDEEDYVTLTKHSGNIPAKTPFLIELQEGATYDSTNGSVLMTVAETADEVEPSTYSMQGNLETTAYTAPEDESTITIYTLQVPSDPSTATTSLVFRKFNGTKLQGCRAYLNTGGTAVKGMRFKEDVETGINSIGTQQSTANTMFDLSGRRVQNAGKGLYIVNGKKMFIK